jgi:hypothetical protein
LGVFEQEVLNKISSEVADVVAADTRLNKRKLLKVTAFGDAFLTEISEKCIKVVIQRTRKFWT